MMVRWRGEGWEVVVVVAIRRRLIKAVEVVEAIITIGRRRARW